MKYGRRGVKTINKNQNLVKTFISHCCSLSQSPYAKVKDSRRKTRSVTAIKCVVRGVFPKLYDVVYRMIFFRFLVFLLFFLLFLFSLFFWLSCFLVKRNRAKRS